MTDPVIVDAHSHVFNADDLPIDGFIKKLFWTPRLLTGIVSVPLDYLAQQSARSQEISRLLVLLQQPGALEAFDAPVEDELVSDAELNRLFAVEWRRLGLLPAPETGALESVSDEVADAQLEAALANAPPREVHELEAWLEECDPDGGDDVPVGDGLEGFTDLFGRVAAAKQAAGRLLAAFRLITRDRHQVAGELGQTYPSVSLFIPALVDFQHTTSDKPSAQVREQIAVHALVAKLSIVGRLPGAPNSRIAPLVGFDPYREVAETSLKDWDPDRGVKNTYVPYAALGSSDPDDRYHRGLLFDAARGRPLHRPKSQQWNAAVLDLSDVRGAIDLVRHAIELGGFVGVKLYPPAGFLPLGNALRFGGSRGERLDAAMRALYGYCVTMDVPILAHASHSNGFEDGYDSFAGPAGWELVLAEYPDLHVSFGHFGHLFGEGLDPATGTDGWPSRFVDLMDRHPHVYADVGNSKLPVSTRYQAQFVALLQRLLGGSSPDPVQRERRRRILYGSDYWLNTLSPGHEGYLTSFKEAFEATFDQSTVEAFMGRNALRFLGFTGADDEPDFANRNRRRFVAFHGGHPTPPWLPAHP